MQRPCISCGELIASGSRCQECKPKENRPRRPGRKGRSTSDWTWRKLSEKMRRLQPWCSECPATEDLTVNHVIPISERPDLAHEELNLTVLCRSCNSKRGDKYTDEERMAVETAIDERNRRRQSFYLRELESTAQSQ